MSQFIRQYNEFYDYTFTAEIISDIDNITDVNNLGEYIDVKFCICQEVGNGKVYYATVFENEKTNDVTVYLRERDADLRELMYEDENNMGTLQTMLEVFGDMEKVKVLWHTAKVLDVNDL